MHFLFYRWLYTGYDSLEGCTWWNFHCIFWLSSSDRVHWTKTSSQPAKYVLLSLNISVLHFFNFLFWGARFDAIPIFQECPNYLPFGVYTLPATWYSISVRGHFVFLLETFCKGCTFWRNHLMIITKKINTITKMITISIMQLCLEHLVFRPMPVH